MSAASLTKSDWLRLSGLGLLIALHFWFPATRSRQNHDSWSADGQGKKAFFLIADERAHWYGFAADRNLRRLLSLPQSLSFDDTLCLLGPERMPTDAEWQSLLDWVSDGGSLVVAARYDKPEFEIRPLKIAVRRWHGNGPAGSVSAEGDASRRFGRAFTLLLSDTNYLWRTRGRLEFPDDAGFQTLLDIRHVPQAVRKRHGRGWLVVLATDFPFSNEAMQWKEQGNAELACRLLDASSPDALTRNVIFDEALNFSGTPKVVGVLLDPLLRPVTLQIVILLFLFAWWQSRRFGPLLPESVQARHNLVDHTDMLGMLHFRSGAGHQVVRAYLRQTLAELNLKGSQGQDERVLAPVARRLKLPVDAVQQILRSAAQSARDRDLDRKQAAEVILQLAQIRRAAQAGGRRRTLVLSTDVDPE